MTIRALMLVNTLTRNSYNRTVKVGMAAVYDQSIPEEQRFTKATPQGTLDMWIDSPEVAEQFSLGQKFYLDFTPVPARS